MEFHHNLLLPALVVSIEFVRPSLPACWISIFVWWAWYFIHYMALTDFLSFDLYPCGGMMPIDFSSKNNFRNTKLQADAIVMQWANGSIPSSSFLVVMKVFLNFRLPRIKISTSDLQYLVISFWKWNVSFLCSSYHGVNFSRSSDIMPVGLYNFMSGRQSRIVCWFSRLLNRCGKYPLANSERLKAFGI